MATVFDVAQYILEKTGRITTVKLEKLVYYAQAWNLVWEEKPLFDSRIEAWANGPVAPELFARHRGMFDIDASSSLGDTSTLKQEEISTIDAVLEGYGDKSAQWLVMLTHMEAPWKKARARAGALVGERCDEEITHADMMDYYSGLVDV